MNLPYWLRKHREHAKRQNTLTMVEREILSDQLESLGFPTSGLHIRQGYSLHVVLKDIHSQRKAVHTAAEAEKKVRAMQERTKSS